MDPITEAVVGGFVLGVWITLSVMTLFKKEEKVAPTVLLQDQIKLDETEEKISE